MKLIFRGHDARYAVEQSLLAFFPQERPVYDPEAEEENQAVVALSQAEKYTTAVTTITYNGAKERGTSRVIIDPAADEYEKERLRQRAVKLSFFKAAQKVTGVTPTWGALTGIRPAKLAAGYLEQGMSPRQVDAILRDTYSVSPVRRELCIEAAQAGLKAKGDLKPEDISLYIGIPFCPTRCAYCSFVSQAVGEMLDYSISALRGANFHPYYLYRQKYMSGSFENIGWCISGAEGLYNIYIMEELHSILSLGAGGSTKMVDPAAGRIERVFHAKYPNEYIIRPEKIQQNLEEFSAFYRSMKK